MSAQSVIHLLERSKSAVVISLRKYFPQQVTQHELETLLLLRNVLKQRQDHLKNRLELGATVERGRHTAELKKHFHQSGKHSITLQLQ